MQTREDHLRTDGPKLLLTRPRQQSERFAELCQKRLGRANIIISPMIRITPIADEIDLSEFEGVILTSENGANALATVACVDGIHAWCVGDRTAAVATELGMQAVSASGDADALVALMVRDGPKGALLHVHGTRTRGDVVTRLRSAGYRAESRVIYEQEEMQLTGTAQACLQDHGPVVLPLFSPRSARLVGDGTRMTSAPLAIIALSRSVAEAWTGPTPSRLAIAERPNSYNMLESIAAVWMELAP